MRSLIAIALIFVSYSTFSQVVPEIYGGLSGSKFKGDGNGDFSRRYTFQSGLLLNISLNGFDWRLKTGAAYSARGVRKSGDDIKLDYVEVPLLLSYGTTIVDLYAGPQVSFLIKDNAHGVESREVGIAYGMNVGLGEFLYTRLNFYQGFTDVFKDSDTKFRNGYISLAIGFRLEPYSGP